jgi:membrane associated rhomboid family serine protease
MSSAGSSQYETILKLCQQASPQPWYADEFAASMGIDPRRLATAIDELRTTGLIETLPSSQGHGLGCRLTRAGAETLQSPVLLARIRGGELPTPTNKYQEFEETSSQKPRSSLSQAVMDCLRNQPRPYATYGIFLLNVAVFLIGMWIAMGGNWAKLNIRIFLLIGDDHARHATGSVSAADLDAGQWWRLLTSSLVHVGFFNILINMSTFLNWGRRAEQVWGPGRFVVIYLICGFVGNCIALWQDPTVVPISSSASICGILAALGAWYLLNARYLPRQIVSSGLRQVIFGLAWWVAWLGLIAFFGGQDFQWQCYLAGMIAGLIVAIPLNVNRFMVSPIRWAFPVLVLLVPLVAAAMLIREMTTSPKWKDAVQTAKKDQEKADRQAVQRAKENVEKGQFDKFNNELMPEIRKAQRFITKQWDPIESLCSQEIAKRNKDELAKAKETVADALQATDSALAAIKSAGRFENEQVSNAVEAADRYLNEQKKLLELVERCLSGGKWTDKDQEDLLEQAKSTLRSWRAYDKKLS